MNIKKPLLIIIPILLLFLLIFFICSDRGSLIKNDNSASSISDSDGIGYMREITPGENMDETSADNDNSLSSGEMADADSPVSENSNAMNREITGTSYKNDDVIVKPSAKKSIVQTKKEPVSDKSRVADTETVVRKDKDPVKDGISEDDSTEDILTEEKTNTARKISAEDRSDSDEKISDNKNSTSEKKNAAAKIINSDKTEAGKESLNSDSAAADKKNEPASGKSKNVAADNKEETDKVATDQSGSSRVKYNRIDRIHLYSGEVLTGAVTVRGQVYTIITPDGTRKVAARDIQSNDIVK